MMRRAGSADASVAAALANDSAGQRRNGLPALTCSTISRADRSTPASARRSSTRRAASGSSGIVTESRARSGGVDAERLEQRPLIQDGMARRHERSRPRHARRVAPAAAGQVITDSLRRARRPRQQPAARPAMKIDHQIEAAGAEAPRERDVVSQSREAARPLEHDDFVDAGMVAHDRFGRRFHEVGDTGAGEAPPKRADRRRGEDHVADQAQSNQKDLQRSVGTSGTWHSAPIFDRRLVDQHHRNVVLDRIHAVTRSALERLSVLHQRDRRLARRAGEDFEQFSVDWHGREGPLGSKDSTVQRLRG